VIATQNPLEQLGTFPLPESQLDRFLMRISLGYPSRDAERKLLAGNGRRAAADALLPVISQQQLQQLQAAALAVHASDALLDYVQDLIAATRNGQWFAQGLSPRAGIALLRAAKTIALMEGRDYVAPDDVQAILAPGDCPPSGSRGPCRPWCRGAGARHDASRAAVLMLPMYFVMNFIA
jgi:MoxR-like ATPase